MVICDPWLYAVFIGQWLSYKDDMKPMVADQHTFN